MSNAIIKPRGVYWRDLSLAEQIEITDQIKNIQNDPNQYEYRYYKTQFHKWIICNAMTVPMKLKKSVWV